MHSYQLYSNIITQSQETILHIIQYGTMLVSVSVINNIKLSYNYKLINTYTDKKSLILLLLLIKSS